MNMNILVTLNSNYIYPLCVMLHSLSETNRSNHFDIYVMYSSLTEDDFDMMKRALGSVDHTLHRIRVDEGVFDSAPVLKRISKETYYRLLISDLIPDEVHRILYLDPDVVILRDLSDFYNMDLGGNALAAGTHVNNFILWLNHIRLRMRRESKYINAGIMLIDADKWREIAPVPEILRFISANIRRLQLADQDVVNMMFEGKIRIFDEKIYNLDEKTFARHSKDPRRPGYIDLEWVRKNTVIIHYNGKIKPWKEKEYDGKLREYFEKYKNF